MHYVKESGNKCGGKAPRVATRLCNPPPVHILAHAMAFGIPQILDVCSWSILDVVYCRTSYTGEGGHWLFCPKSFHNCKPKVIIKSPTILDTVFTPSKRVLEEMSRSPIILHILGKRFFGSWVEWAHVQHNPNISCLMPLHLTVCTSYFPWRRCPSFYLTIFSSLVPLCSRYSSLAYLAHLVRRSKCRSSGLDTNGLYPAI